jgi:hypothetical protein
VVTFLNGVLEYYFADAKSASAASGSLELQDRERGWDRDDGRSIAVSTVSAHIDAGSPV